MNVINYKNKNGESLLITRLPCRDGIYLVRDDGTTWYILACFSGEKSVEMFDAFMSYNKIKKEGE